MLSSGHQYSLSKTLRGCRSWEDFSKRLSLLPEKQKGDLFEQLVKEYLLLDPEYATTISQVWIHHEVPSAIRKQLHLPDSDQGIDLIAKTKSGEFWAIQCKYRSDSSRPIPWKEISTFTGLTFGVCKGISFGLICSTTERITHVLKKQDRIGFCALDEWQGLDAEFFSRIRASVDRKKTKLKPLLPRLHQVEAVKAAKKHFLKEKKNRGKLIMPCGTGKSLTSYWIAGELGSRRVVIAVPSLALIRQTLKVWLREAMASGKEVQWICVCSDESAGKVGSDDVSVLRQDLGVPCLTDPKEISKWLSKKSKGLQVVFTTYQSGEALSAAAKKSKFRFDLGIMDEAHKTVGDGEKLFSHLLYDKNLPIERRVFMTATERRYQGRGDKILSMDDPKIYGDTFHLLSFRAALEQKPPILCDYRIVTIMVSREEVAEMVRKNVFVRPSKGSWNKEMESEMLTSLVALRKAMQKYPIKHAVSFHGSISKAEHFAVQNESYNRAFPRFGHVDSFHVSGATPTGTRSRMINEFAQQEKALITNARCLTEGVDVPDIDCVLFADPRKSAVDIVQAVGRALRPSPGKKLGYVIVPILHDAKARAEKLIESGEFQEILTTLRALASNDDRIIEYFRAIANGKKRATGGSVSFDIDEQIAKKIDVDQFIRDIDLKCWHRLAKLSWRPFEEAREFVRSLRLSGYQDWSDYCTGRFPSLHRKPADIPSNAALIYQNQGWVGFGDWLGTGTIATQKRKYLPFYKARTFAHSLCLKNGNEWRVFCKGEMPNKGKLPPDIPANPLSIYANKGWKGMGDWLGTGNLAPGQREYLQFKAARAFIQGLGLKNQKDWTDFCRGRLTRLGRLPEFIPSKPSRVYADTGWISLGDWLGTGRIASKDLKYRPFEEARAFARSLQLKSGNEWVLFCRGKLVKRSKLPLDIPIHPRGAYRGKGWVDMGDWLGTGNVAPHKKVFWDFERGREFARGLKLKGQKEWQAFCRGGLPSIGSLPRDIPSNPQSTYKESGWNGFGDWLGTGNISNRDKEFRSFSAARSFVRGLELKSHKEWVAYCNGNILNLPTIPSDIPKAPEYIYAKLGWNGFGDWLGTGNISPRFKVYKDFLNARAFVRRLKLKSTSEWRLLCAGKLTHLEKLSSDIPANPNQTYKSTGWAGYGDWLGTGTVANQKRKYPAFVKARAFARSLNLKSENEWRAFCRGLLTQKGSLPDEMSASPMKTYKNKGWKGMGDWLGTGNVSGGQRGARKKQVSNS
jgi:superfamily II DNA or RNA helicase